ncbi:hypothetical protein [Sporosarcina gallistercoris]|uniref:Uncharacterized protein n=1 Tax=Sporosarcina gallistercoris TaxID=2762245 RepID=A0ABR8PJQ6_9BACL|nr:hypothetical protein [Sporosarcina gallistercoris]MBD7908426.1 hypothetical protein [Sporosarcina gallistercoris]
MSKVKPKLLIAVLSCVIIVAIGTGIIEQMNKNHQANERIIEKCFENFDEQAKVAVVKESFWSSVTCEKQQ